MGDNERRTPWGIYIGRGAGALLLTLFGADLSCNADDNSKRLDNIEHELRQIGKTQDSMLLIMVDEHAGERAEGPTLEEHE